MSIIEFLTVGGMGAVAGDPSEAEQKFAKDIVGRLAEDIRNAARTKKIPVARLKIFHAKFLVVAKDKNHLHFVFAENFSGNKIVYRDYSNEDLNLNGLREAVENEIGDIVFTFSIALYLPASQLNKDIGAIADRYMHSIIENNEKNSGNPNEEAIENLEIAPGIKKFRSDYPASMKTAFIMMQFGDTKAHRDITDSIKNALSTHGIVGLRADDKQYMDDLFSNIKTYMHGCDFGIAVFDRIIEDDFNPNVSLEIGYMMGMSKDVLLLKDKTLKSLPSDLTGKLYKPFDTQDLQGTIPQQMKKWLTDKGLL